MAENVGLRERRNRADKPVDQPGPSKPRTRASLGKGESLTALDANTAAAASKTSRTDSTTLVPSLRPALGRRGTANVNLEPPRVQVGAKRRSQQRDDDVTGHDDVTDATADADAARVKRMRTSEPELDDVLDVDDDEDLDADVADDDPTVNLPAVPYEPAKDEGWEDLDAGDEDDPLMVSEYVNEVYDYLLELETQTMPNPEYMLHQKEITWKMRGILVDWLVEVHGKFRLLPETMFLAVHLVDRIALVRFQLVGVTALFIAAKYEEIVCPSVQNFLYMTDGGYTEEEILKAERYMLQLLNFQLSWPNPLHFLRRISKADGYDVQSRTIAKYLLEISTVDRAFLATPPSLAAAGSAWLARKILERGTWSANLVHYSRYSEAEVLSTAQLMLDYIVRSLRLPEPEHPCLHRKYAAKKYFRASELCADWAERRYKCTAKHGAIAASFPVRLEEHLDHA